MFKLFRFTVFITFICIVNIYCKKDKETQNADQSEGIYYKEVNSSLSFSQSSSLKIDIDQDGTNDFEIYKDKYNTDIDSLKGFFVRNLAQHKMITINLTDNPLFDCQNLMSHTGEEVISESLTAEYSWSSKNGLLAMRHEPNPTFIARWSDGNAKTMAIRFVLKGKVHFGWMKLQYSRENNSISLLSYAYNKSENASIKVGQTQ